MEGWDAHYVGSVTLRGFQSPSLMGRPCAMGLGKNLRRDTSP